MGTGLYIQGGENININNLKSTNCATAVHAANVDKLQVNGISTKECDKSLQLDNCWDADIKGLNIETKRSKLYFRETLLSYTIRFFMNGRNI